MTKSKKKNNNESDLSGLTYQESLEELDYLIDNLQNENLPVEELQQNYLKANLFLQHCQKLLDNVEQEVINVNPTDLNQLTNQ